MYERDIMARNAGQSTKRIAGVEFTRILHLLVITMAKRTNIKLIGFNPDGTHSVICNFNNVNVRLRCVGIIYTRVQAEEQT